MQQIHWKLDACKNPVPTLEPAREEVLALDQVGETMVATLFKAIDCSRRLDDPLLFATSISPDCGKSWHFEAWFSTRKQALAYHENMLMNARVKHHVREFEQALKLQACAV
jgi:hypothetical protein